MIGLIVKAALSYLLGSIVGSLVVGRLRGGVDIRSLGSGNAGGTNALRTQGKAFAFWVMLIDIGKGWLAVRGIAPLELSQLPQTAAWQEWTPTACAVASIAGHVYPLWHGFRGGKGVATLLGTVLGLDAWLLPWMLCAWLLVVAVTGFVGLASIVAAGSLVVGVVVGHLEPRTPLLVFGCVAAASIAATHRANIARMRAGTEPRARRLWVLGRGRA